MTEQQIIKFLANTGHWGMPHGRTMGPFPAGNAGVDSSHGRLAVESFQAFNSSPLEVLINEQFSQGPFPIVTGEVNAPTLQLMETARCSVPDYALTEELLGAGNWPNCWGAAGHHRAIINVKSSTIPSHITPIWPALKSLSTQAYAEQGLELVWKENLTSGYNLDLSFVQPDGSWIGLATVLNKQKCGDRGWLRLDRNYRPANLQREFLTLLKHELGHCCGMGHSNKGVMNSYIIPGLGVSWKGDPSEPLLRARFGGQPIPSIPPVSRQLVTAWRYPDGSYETINVIPDGDSSGPFPT